MPQRFLRPGITNSERWNRVPFDAQSLFIRLLTLVDDFGRFDGRSAVIAAHTFAVWNEINSDDKRNLQQVERMLQQLEKTELIDRYEIEGKKVLQIAQWQERIRDGVKEKWPCRNLQQVDLKLLPSSSSPRIIDQNHRLEVNGSKPILSKSRCTQKEAEDFCESIGLPRSDGEAMFLHWEEKGWAKVKDWKLTIRKWKSFGYMPSQKGSKSKPKQEEKLKWTN